MLPSLVQVLPSQLKTLEDALGYSAMGWGNARGMQELNAREISMRKFVPQCSGGSIRLVPALCPRDVGCS